MSQLLSKIGLDLETYWQAWSAIGRQFEPAEITKIQNKKLQNLIRYSFHNIKYYREVFKQLGIEPKQIKTAEDLHKIPILTKEQLRGRFWDFLPNELPVCRVSRTSGSTGIPVCILSDRNSRMFNSAAVIRYRRALGIGFIGKPILTPLKTANEPCRKKAHWTYLQGIHRTYYVNPYVDSQENIKYATELLTELKKPALIGITPAIRTLAYKVKDGVFPYFQPSAILTTGESLSSEVRHLLESTFGTNVADIYACNEAGDVAWQCRYGAGYHINADNVIVETVKNDKPVADGQIGEVVITNLNRYAMPIIRYKNGDLAILMRQSCPCGCKLPMITKIVGRTGEDIFLPNGKAIPWNQLKSLMNHPRIRQFQLVQGIDGSFKIKYMVEPATDIKALELLLDYRFRSLLGDSIHVVSEQVSRIDPTSSGKSKLVVSHYKPSRIQLSP
jgi:phenylacetate-CoA ligase